MTKREIVAALARGTAVGARAPIMASEAACSEAGISLREIRQWDIIPDPHPVHVPPWPMLRADACKVRDA